MCDAARQFAALRCGASAARNAYYELSTGVGDQRLRRWLEQPTRADGRWATLDAVEQELEAQEQRWKRGQTLLPFTAWPQLEAAWWFEHDYSGTSVDVLTNDMLLLSNYTGLLDAGASAAEAKAWAAERDLSGRAAAAFAELHLIRAALGEN